MNKPKKLIIFDLDNTLRFSNREDGLIFCQMDIDKDHRYYLDTWTELSRLMQQNVAVGVATNQCAVYDYWCSINSPEAAHRQTRFYLDSYFESMLHGGDLFDYAFAIARGSIVAKPNPGMLIWLAGRFQVYPEEIIMVGDSWKDCLAARSFGCEFIKVGDFGYTQNGTTPMPENIPAPDLWFDSAYSAVLHLLER